jgi:DNA-binding CsgD family transcriptional regulator
MHPISERQLNALIQGVAELYPQRDTEAVKAGVLSLVANLIGVDIATVDQVQPDGSVLLHTYPADAKPTVDKATPVLAEHLPTHPAMPAFFSRDPRPMRMSDLVPLGRYRTTGIYNEVYRPFGVLYQLNVMPPGEELRQTAVTLHRKSRDFTEADRTILSLIAPHFARAYRNALAWTRQQAERQLMTRALSAQLQETVFLGNWGEPLYLPPRAQAWWPEYFPNRPQISGLPDQLADWVRSARAAQARSEVRRTPQPPLLLNGPEGRLEIQWFSDDEGREMLLLTEKRSIFAGAGLKEIGLTPRESEVLRWIAEGKTDSEIGVIIGATEHTAHKHVQHILQKLGVSNRATAVLRVCELLRVI